MYHSPGEYVTDFCIVRRHGVYHLFHIRGERWTWPMGYREIDLGHAISTDLRHWQPQDPVLPVGRPGAWDECGNWAPHIIEVDGLYYLYYTGSDANNNQKIGLATSDDLYTWNFHPANPLVEPGTWSDRDIGRDVAGRDPMVFTDSLRNRYLMYYTATMHDGRACIALAQSTDLIHWEDLGPTYLEDDRSFNRLESAYVVQHADRYYLFYSAKGGPKSKGYRAEEYAHFDIVYLISDEPAGGWQKPVNHLLLTGWSCASEHPTFDGATYMFYILQEAIDGIWGASSLSDPKRIVWMSDGTVRIHEHLPDTLSRQTIFHSSQDTFSEWVQHGGAWSCSSEAIIAPVTSGDAFLLDTRWGSDLILEADVSGEQSSIASLVIRGNPSALAGYRVSLDFGRSTLGLYHRFPARGDTPLQERNLTFNPDEWHHLKVVAQGPFFEIYLDEALCMVHYDRLFDSGCYGLHAQGNVTFKNLRASVDLSPDEASVDWDRRCKPKHLFS